MLCGEAVFRRHSDAIDVLVRHAVVSKYTKDWSDSNRAIERMVLGAIAFVDPHDTYANNILGDLAKVSPSKRIREAAETALGK